MNEIFLAVLNAFGGQTSRNLLQEQGPRRVHQQSSKGLLERTFECFRVSDTLIKYDFLVDIHVFFSICTT